MPSTLPKTRAFLWKKGQLSLLDQRLLPHKTVWVACRTWQDVADGIRDMVVRGAPAIGCVAAYGVVLASRAKKFNDLASQRAALALASEGLLKARPTAVNLRWALQRLQTFWEKDAPSPEALSTVLEVEAISIEEQDRLANQKMGELGSKLLPANATLLTICNTGSLATAGLGTAFGVIWTAHKKGRVREVYASETRPYLQGARLTAWELKEEGIPFQLITDNMAAHLMKTEKIHAVLAGADRIAANGDTANKIGTYSLAVLASYHGIPFYIVAPTTTIDLSTHEGRLIPIEERSSEEVTSLQGQKVAPVGTKARHPAFDVTPAELISGIITERGVAYAPYRDSLKHQFDIAVPAGR